MLSCVFWRIVHVLCSQASALADSSGRNTSGNGSQIIFWCCLLSSTQAISRQRFAIRTCKRFPVARHTAGPKTVPQDGAETGASKDGRRPCVTVRVVHFFTHQAGPLLTPWLRQAGPRYRHPVGTVLCVNRFTIRIQSHPKPREVHLATHTRNLSV